MSDSAANTDTSPPLVSVIIPAFNCAQFIEAAIDSVLAQTEQRFEIIVIDDASTDATYDVVARYTDKRIHLIRNEKNSGQSYSRNVGILRAKAEWIALLDADDWFAPARLERLLAYAQAEQAEAVADDLFIIINGQQKPRSTWFLECGITWTKPLVIGPCEFIAEEIGVIKPIFRRSLFVERGLRYENSINYGEDFLLYFSWLLNDVRFLIVPDAYYFLRRGNTGSLTTDHITLVEKVCDLTVSLLQRESVQRRPKVVSALHERLHGLQQLLAYHRVLFPLRHGHIAAACKGLYVNPNFLYVLMLRIPSVIAKHTRCFFWRLRQ